MLRHFGLSSVDVASPAPTDMSLGEISENRKFTCIWALLRSFSKEQGMQPGQAVTFDLLRQVLEPLGVEEFDMASLFFSLDEDHRGMLTEEEFRARWAKALESHPRFSERSEELLSSICRRMHELSPGICGGSDLASKEETQVAARL